mgnify:CR=1 FL=1
MTADNVLFEIKGLKKNFGDLEVLKGIHTTIRKGEVVVVIGPSGSGKSTIGRSVIRLYDPTAGTIKFNGMDIGGKMNKETNKALRTQMQMIFQDPMASLNPRKKVRDIPVSYTHLTLPTTPYV